MHNIAAAVDKPFMNDNVCQILFGLVGMSTIYYYPERDLLFPQISTI
jgi:heptose-I-phosphate ethanolaminephosphotransferase